METILIKPELLELTKQGFKTTTCRKGIRNYPLGKTKLQSNNSDDYCYINITGLKYCKLKDVTNDIAKADGFDNKNALKKVMSEIYTDITDDTDITVVCYERSVENADN